MRHAAATRHAEREERLAPIEQDLAAIASLAFATDLLDLRVLPRGPLLPDARTTYLLCEGGGQPRAVAQLACDTAPGAVAIAVARAEAVRAVLDPTAAAPVLRPVASGAIDGTSYAIWPWCRPLARTTGSYLERRRLAGPLFAWVESVARSSARPATADEVESRFAAPLCRMTSNAALRTSVRVAARSALAALDRGAWKPVLVAMHGDLHTGNVLLDTRGETGPIDGPLAERFALIDWGGARPDGHAVYDWIRLAHSLRAETSQLPARLQAYCRALQAAPSSAPWYLAAAFAELGDQLEHFPVDRYAALAELCFSMLAAAGAPAAW